MNKQQAQAAADTALNVAINALSVIAMVNDTLKTAQDEGWTDTDPRWAAPFAEADKALAEAEDALRQRLST